MKKDITCCYLPTTTLFVDDRKNFLENLTLNLDEKLSYRTFINPKEAVIFLKDHQNSKSLFKEQSPPLKNLKDIDEPHSHCLADLDISVIHQFFYSPNRFRKITVAVVDYAMPKMNGLEFCRALKKLTVKKLMMTGEASDAIAVEAFNEGIIDKFIRKQSQNFYEELHLAINALQKKYFEDISRTIIEHLAPNEDCWLSEDDFIPLFQKTIEEKQIIEYYLIDQSGSFLMLDAKGRVYWLIVKSEHTLNGFLHIAEDNEAPKSIQNTLKTKSKIPFFLTEKDLEVHVDEWARYLHPAKVLKGKNQPFYYTLIGGDSIYDIDEENIVSYDDYLKLL